jgi:hypothetical protein
VSIGSGAPAKADVCAHLTSQIGTIVSDIAAHEAYLRANTTSLGPAHLTHISAEARHSQGRLNRLRKQRANYLREYRRTGCAAMQDARAQRATQQAVDTTLGIIGFGIGSGLLGGHRPSRPSSSPYPSSRRRY